MLLSKNWFLYEDGLVHKTDISGGAAVNSQGERDLFGDYEIAACGKINLFVVGYTSPSPEHPVCESCKRMELMQELSE